MIGAIAGDILGSYYEFEGIKDYNLPLLPPESRFTGECNKILSPKLLEYLTEFEVFIMKKSVTQI